MTRRGRCAWPQVGGADRGVLRQARIAGKHAADWLQIKWWGLLSKVSFRPTRVNGRQCVGSVERTGKRPCQRALTARES